LLEEDEVTKLLDSRDEVTNISTVARIAYLSSDVIVSVQPSLAIDSEFSKFLKNFAGKNASGVVAQGTPEVCLVEKLQACSHADRPR